MRMDNTTAAWVIWLILLVGALVLESISMQLFSVWFAAGALAALIASLLDAPVWLQVTLFIVVTAASLAATRPLVKKLHSKIQPTNADRYLGRTGIVIEEIDNRKATGQIKVDGSIWTARSLGEGDVIAIDQLVQVKEIQGVKAMVARVESAVEAKDTVTV